MQRRRHSLSTVPRGLSERSLSRVEWPSPDHHPSNSASFFLVRSRGPKSDGPKLKLNMKHKSWKENWWKLCIGPIHRFLSVTGGGPGAFLGGLVLDKRKPGSTIFLEILLVKTSACNCRLKLSFVSLLTQSKNAALRASTSKNPCVFLLP